MILDYLMRSKNVRAKTKMKNGSPIYHYDVPVIVAGARVEFTIDRQFPAAKKYEPLDTMTIINNDSVNITLNINGVGGTEILVPNGTIRQVTREELPAIWQVRITNNDSVNATTLNMIDIEFQRAPETVDTIARGKL
jgi:hypothetical protein